METEILSQYGQTCIISIQKTILAQMDWHVEDQLELECIDTKLSITKKKAVKRYNLEEILSGVEAMPKEDIVDWGKPQGSKVW